MTASLRYENLTSEQRDLADVADKYFADAPDAPQAGADLGWFAVGTDAESGGVGGSSADLAILIEAAGAALAQSCLGAAALVVIPTIAARLHNDVRQQLLDGQLSVGLAVGSPWEVADAITADGGLHGELVMLGPEHPDVLAVPTRAGGDEHVLLIDAADGSIAREPLASADVTRHLTRLRFEGTAGNAVLEDVTGRDLFTEFEARRVTVAALDAVGAARAAFAKTLEYAATRTQFGQPIGSFQAYKHRCANALIELKLAQSLAFAAARAAGTERGRLLGLAAGRCATANATFICGESVQLHGGIGFTWESGLHAFLKRSRVDEILGRGCARTRSRLLELDALDTRAERQEKEHLSP